MSNNENKDGDGPAAGNDRPGAAPAGPAAPGGARPAVLARAPQAAAESDAAARPGPRKLPPVNAAPDLPPATPLAARPRPAAAPASPQVSPQAQPASPAAPPTGTAPSAGPPAPPPPAATPAAPPPGPTARPSAAAAAAAPIEAFLSPGREHRLRDLLAFGMAVEGGKPVAPDTIDALRRQADAELEAYAFRSLHNRVEEIRRAAIDEQLAKLRQTPGFQGIVVANLVSMIAAAMIALLLWWLHAVFTMGS